MTRLWMYTLAASNNPDLIDCVVPWQVDDDLIFFGPCKKRIRERLRGDFLRNTSHRVLSENDDQTYIVGVNGSNPENVRKIVWAGRLSEVMTFPQAPDRMKGDVFREMRQHPSSPLHVRPLLQNGLVLGYEHISAEHQGRGKKKYDTWVYDLIANPDNGYVRVENNGHEDKRVVSLDAAYPAVFDRDCCMLLESVFFANGRGIGFDEVGLELMRQAQPHKSEIDDYAIFGRSTSGQANGLRGTYLEISSPLAERVVEWIKLRSSTAERHEQPEQRGVRKSGCGENRPCGPRSGASAGKKGDVSRLTHNRGC